ncbi:MAG: group II intron reverse transcriptase/maturase [Planctomycetes bacterium]|nr:group II intron reverse transcriptase/maturase [Planctomycetota bacterium]
MPDKVGSEIDVPTSLRGIAKTASLNKQHRFRDLYRLLNIEMLRLAWKELNKNSAIADEDITVKEYAVNLDVNLERLVERLKQKRYRAKLIKRSYIPKENGKLRPLGIPALEDKIIQKAVAMILTSIYEQEFLDCSYGYRLGKGAKDAVSDLVFQLQYGVFGYIVEADIRGYFDNIDHDKLLSMLEKRINDRAFTRLISKWLKAGILEPEGYVKHPVTGTPQGGIVSPVLSNLYLHTVLDEWFQNEVKPRLRGRAIMCRYADDWVCAFQYKDDAKRFYDVLPKRLERYELQVEPSKTKILRFSRFNPSRKGDRVFTFLGFEFHWFKDRNGIPRVKRRTAPSKQKSALSRMKVWLKASRNLPKKQFFKTLKQKLIGHYNYYYVRGNSRSVWSFYGQVIELAKKWLNRRSQRKSYTWEKFKRVLEYQKIPKPRMTEKRRLHQCALR